MPRAKFTKQKDGRYRTSVFTGKYTDDGYPIKKYLSARTIKELEEKVMKTQQDLKEEMNIFDESITFGRYAQKWFTTYKSIASIRTQNMYESCINKNLIGLFELRLADISTTTLQILINDKSEHPRTCEIMELTLKQIFKSAIRDKLLRDNPAENLTLPRHIPIKKRALTPSEKEAVKNADLNPRQRAFVSLLQGTGMRPGEIYALTWSDIDFTNEIINVNKALTFDGDRAVVVLPKTNDSVRVIQAPHFVFDKLQEYKKECEQLIIFHGANGKYRGKNRYAEEWAAIRRLIGKALNGDCEITPYYFRHNFCTELYYSGISLLEAQRLMGHSSAKMIMEIYSHLDAEREDTRGKLNAINF